MAEPISITIEDLSKKVEEGWKKPALAEHYGLPVTQMTKLLKEAGLKIRKFHAPKYVLVSDSAAQEAASTAEIDISEVEGVIIAEDQVEDLTIEGQSEESTVVGW